jgi:hypothetical protein
MSLKSPRLPRTDVDLIEMIAAWSNNRQDSKEEPFVLYSNVGIFPKLKRWELVKRDRRLPSYPKTRSPQLESWSSPMKKRLENGSGRSTDSKILMTAVVPSSLTYRLLRVAGVRLGFCARRPALQIFNQDGGRLLDCSRIFWWLDPSLVC